MNEDEKIKNAISAWLDNEATPEEREIAERSVKEGSVYAQYYQDLQKISIAVRSWKDEDVSPDWRQKLKKIKEREGFSMKNLIQKVNVPFAGSLAVAVMAVMVVNHLPEQSEKVPSLKVTQREAKIPQAVTETETLPASLSPVRADVRTQSEFLTRNEKKSQYFKSKMFSDYESYSETQASSLGLFARRSSQPEESFNTGTYNFVEELSFRNALESPLSTFSIDVDTASYSNIRRFLNDETMPPQDSVRIEEMINYFHYDYPQPEANDPFSITTEVGECPWMPEHQLVSIALKGKDLDQSNLPPSNLVFLIDVSGSMNQSDKLPLLQKALRKLVQQLSEKEKVAIVTYAGNAGLVLPSTPGSEKSKILQAIHDLTPGGSTAGGEGIELAYQIAKENFISKGNNRVILGTDGDFNVGVSNDGELVRIIEAKRNDGIFLTVLGFGDGNLKDSKMEQLANKGNGNYFYIDSINEAQKVLVRELGSTLFTIAKDVKIQVEFNPASIKSYRLVGYENRALANEDFNNDKKDAGELGAGHTVTALYEIVPTDSKEQMASIDPLKYQQSHIKKNDELLTIKLRYKEPEGAESKLITRPVKQGVALNSVPSENFKLAAAVAEFGLVLRKSPFKANAHYQHVLNSLNALKSEDPEGYRKELAVMVEKASSLDDSPSKGIKFKK